MRRVTVMAAFVVGVTALAAASDRPAKLVGRWRSENMPIGYWVVDRYSDGRLAKKWYVQFSSDKPAEIAVTWGRWRLRGKSYCELFESATSQNMRKYCGKWWKMEIQRITDQRFYHLSGDGHDTFEDRFPESGPLLDVRQPPPKQYGWRKLIDTMTPARATIPRWVHSVPDRAAVKKGSEKSVKVAGQRVELPSPVLLVLNASTPRRSK